MARMIPDFSRHIDKAPPFRKTGNPELDRGRQTEKELYIFLRDLLPDNWVVRYSFEFTRRTDELIEHEADFVVVIPRCGVLVLEVKASESYGLRNGVWYFDPECRHVREGNPFSQARATRFELKRKIQDYMHKSFPGLFGSIVVFPNARRIPGENAAPSSQDPDIIMTGYDLVRDVRNRSLARHLEHTLTLFGDHDLVEIRRSAFNQKEMDAVVRFLEDNYTLEPYRAFTDTYYSHLLDQLTQEQIRLLSSLTRNRRVMVFGPAGSGKTMLARWAAMNEAQQLAEKKGRVLLLSYSPVLAAYFSIENTLDNLEITTFQALCAELLKKLAPEMKVPPESASEESRKRFWLDELPSLLEEHPETACYDAVYIDEAQDFDPLWAPALAGLLRDPEQSKLYCFGDPNQKIFENSLDNDFEGFTLFELRENCRNTREIAEMCQRMNGTLEKTAVHDISYRRPEVYPAIADAETRAEFLARRINELLRSGISPANIAVLSPWDYTDSRCSLPQLAAKLHKPLLGECHIRSGAECSIQELIRTLEKWRNGECIWGGTIHAFKGLESDHILLTDLPVTGTPGFSRRDFYVGASRAKLLLYLLPVSEKAEEEIRGFVGREIS